MQAHVLANILADTTTDDPGPLHSSRRSPQDVADCGLHFWCASGDVLPDDGPAHLLGVTFLPPVVGAVNGLAIRIEEVG